jgi:polysaccharide pyruvyl transferase CsaB
MKILHLIGGGDVGGAKIHVLSLVKKLSESDEVKILSFRYGVFYEDAKSMGLDIEIVKTGTIITDVHKVIKIINSGYDIVHSHGSKANMVAVLSKPFIKVPLITTIHSDYKLDYLNNIFKTMTFGKINTIALRFIDFYIAVSSNFKSMLISRNFNISSIFQIPNGLDFSDKSYKYSRINFLRKYDIEHFNNKIIVGILTRFHPVKDVSTFIKAANHVLKTRSDIAFLIAGDGEEREHLKNMVKKYGISNNIIFLGFISDDPFEFMNAIDINVLSSLSEGFPYTILEGALFKNPTVSSDVGGITELIEHGKNGLLFEAKDYKTLSKYILTLIKDTNLRKKLGNNIYNDAYKKYSLETMKTIQLDIYKKSLSISRYKKSKSHKEKYKKYDFLISGYYGSGNIGDNALLTAIINDILKFKPNAKIAVLSRNPEETKKIYKVDSYHRLVLFNIIKTMKNTKVFISGGGSLIQDIKSSRSLIYYLATIFIAKMLKLKVILYANGIGPVNKKINRPLTRRILNTVNLITLRDEVSKSELYKLNITKPKITVTADPALTISPDTDINIDKIFKEECIDSSNNLVGFSVRNWSKVGDFETNIAKTADYIYEKHGYKPLFIPMQFPDDYIMSKKILLQTNCGGHILKNSYNASELMGIMKHLKFTIGMRLHALIFSASVYTPIIGIEYENKVKSFLKYINIDKTCFAGHIRNLNEKNIREIIDSVVHNRENYVNILKNNIDNLKLKALVNAEMAVSELDNKRRSLNDKKILARR